MTTSVAPYWDVFAPPVLDNSTIQYECLEYLDNRQNVVNQTYYNLVSQDLDQFMYPSNSYIEVGVNLRDPNGNFIYQGQVALSNGGFNLFDRAQYLINDSLIEDVEYPGLVTQVTGLVNDNKSFAETSVTEMWAPDTGDGSITGDGDASNFTPIATFLHVSANADTTTVLHAGIDNDGHLVKIGGVAAPLTDVEFSVIAPQPGPSILPVITRGTFTELETNFFMQDPYNPSIIERIRPRISNTAAGGGVPGGSNLLEVVIAEPFDYSGNELFLYVGNPAHAQNTSPPSTLRALKPFARTFKQGINNNYIPIQYPVRFFLSKGIPNTPPAPAGYTYYIQVSTDYLSTILQTRFSDGTYSIISVRFSDPVIDGASNCSMPSKNKGFVARRDAFYNNRTGLYDREVTLYLPITRVFKLFEKNRRVFRGMKHEIRLYKNKKYRYNNLVVKSPDAPVVTVNINKISWWIPVLKPNDAVLLDVNSQCNSGKSTQLYWGALNCINGQDIVITPTTSFLNWRITSSSRKPLRLWVIFQNKCRYDNSDVEPNISDEAAITQCYNSMLFDDIGVSSAYIRIGRNQYPMIQYGPLDFTAGSTENIARLFNTYLQMSNTVFDKKHNEVNAKFNSGLTYDEFRTLYPMLCFDMSSQDDGIWTNNTEIDISLFATLDGSKTGTFMQYAIVEYQHSITIQGANNRLTIVM